MTAVTTTSASDAANELLSKLRDINSANAYIAAQAMTPIIERLGIEGAVTPDFEMARKTLEALQKVAVHPEKQESARAGATAAAAVLTIILDDTPQVAPPRRRKALANVSDAIEIQAAPAPPTADTPFATPTSEPAELPWGEI